MKKLSELFEVRSGHCLELHELRRVSRSNGIAFVSRKGRDNGIVAYVARLPGIVPGEAGELTCALSGRGTSTILSTFLQDQPYYTGHHVARLAPKCPMMPLQKLYYCACVEANRYRYSFGRQANRTLKDLLLPAPNELPGWLGEVEMADFCGKGAPALIESPSELNTKNWRPFKMAYLFEIKRGYGLAKDTRQPGPTPYIGALDRDNGLVGHVAQAPRHPAGTMTLNWNGNGVGVAFYQPVAYWCSGDVNALYPRFKMTPAIAMFLSTIIRRERYRYSFGRKLTAARLKATEIRLPAIDDNTPDWNFMDHYIKLLSFSSQL